MYRFCLQRKLMMERMIESVTEFLLFEYDDIINESHNFAAWENHFGANVLVHRKGATRACEGELGMIPGSQGTKSYIVRGLVMKTVLNPVLMVPEGNLVENRPKEN